MQRSCHIAVDQYRIKGYWVVSKFTSFSDSDKKKPDWFTADKDFWEFYTIVNPKMMVPGDMDLFNHIFFNIFIL